MSCFNEMYCEKRKMCLLLARQGTQLQLTYPAIQVQCSANTFPVTFDKNVDKSQSWRLFMSADENDTCSITLQRMAQWELLFLILIAMSVSPVLSESGPSVE